MKITPGITFASGDTVSHTTLNNFLSNATITSDSLDQVALGDSALDSLTSGADNVGIGDNAGTTLTNGHSNVLVGTDAGQGHASGYYNVALGFDAMKGGTGSPAHNVAIGGASLAALSGDIASDQSHGNTAVGNGAGNKVTTGFSNTFLGSATGQEVTTGCCNIAIGVNAMTDLPTSSANNVAIGFRALGVSTTANTGTVAIGMDALANNTANGNVGVGFQAGENNTSGEDNTYLGQFAGFTNITGNDNTFVGDYAGVYVTGSQNTAVGSSAHADAGDAGLSNTTTVGYACNPTASNQVMLGNTSVTDLRCEDTSIAAISSDKRIKKNVVNNKLGLDFLNALRTVTYKKINPADWPAKLKEARFKGKDADPRPKDDEETHHGMIAQEVKKVLDEQGISDWRGWREDPNGKQNLAYGALIMPLVKAVQELSAKVAKLEAK